MCPIAWCGVWRERNARCFEGSKHSLLEIKSFFLQTLLVWSVALSHCSCFSLLALLDHCNFGFWFLPPLYIPNVLGLAIFFLLKFFPYLSKKIILFSIAQWLVTCGHLYLLSLGFLESCQRGSVFFIFFIFFLLINFTSQKKKKRSYAKGKI